MAPTMEDLAQTYVTETRFWLENNVGKIKHCLSQLNEEQVWWRPHESINSVANVILHLCGNIRQRILSTVDGEPDRRDRPTEFTQRGPMSKAELIRHLDDVTRTAQSVLVGLSAAELTERRRYRGLHREFDGTVLSVILHCLLHLSGHVQEIVYITRLQLGDDYRFQVTPSVDG